MTSREGIVSFMAKYLLRACLLLLVFTVLCGLAYPFIVTGLASIVFPGQSQGSLQKKNGKIIGSTLIGQNFASPRYFHGRPSAAGILGYDAAASGGSNLGPTNRALIDTVAKRIAKIKAENGLPSGAVIPGDLVTASASGLDPHISPAAALLQVPRVARARNLPEKLICALVKKNTEEPQFGFLGEPRVNVLKLNLALDNVSLSK